MNDGRPVVSQNALPAMTLVGTSLFISAFFLPTLGPASTVDYFGEAKILGTNLPGWAVAETALRMLLIKQTYSTFTFFGAFSALLNLFVVFFIACGFSARLFGARPYLAVASLVCIVSSWIYLGHTMISIGHPVWVAGALLILSPEIAMWRLALGRHS